jgi:hypothetical protein
MKDFDDLWRLNRSVSEVDATKLRKLLRARGAEPRLDTGWIDSNMERMWAAHRKRYRDLPERLEELFMEVNTWMAGLIGRRAV